MCHRTKKNQPPATTEYPYGDGDIPEIDTKPYHQSATGSIPEEMPQHNYSDRSQPGQ